MFAKNADYTIPVKINLLMVLAALLMTLLLLASSEAGAAEDLVMHETSASATGLGLSDSKRVSQANAIEQALRWFVTDRYGTDWLSKNELKFKELILKNYTRYVPYIKVVESGMKPGKGYVTKINAGISEGGIRKVLAAEGLLLEKPIKFIVMVDLQNSMDMASIFSWKRHENVLEALKNSIRNKYLEKSEKELALLFRPKGLDNIFEIPDAEGYSAIDDSMGIENDREDEKEMYQRLGKEAGADYILAGKIELSRSRGGVTGARAVARLSIRSVKDKGRIMLSDTKSASSEGTGDLSREKAVYESYSVCAGEVLRSLLQKLAEGRVTSRKSGVILAGKLTYKELAQIEKGIKNKLKRRIRGLRARKFAEGRYEFEMRHSADLSKLAEYFTEIPVKSGVIKLQNITPDALELKFERAPSK